jgi:ribosomal protein S18 acetylase RimI-like enzyme
MEPAVLDATRAAIRRDGAASLTVNDLTAADLGRIAWSGGPLHVPAVAHALERAEQGEVDYLAVRSPDGWPVSIGGVDYGAHNGAGTLWQLATHGELTGLGIGTCLITALEDRIGARGLPWAMLGVEVGNTRARALYDRLGYEPCGHARDSWPEADDQGNVFTYHAELTLMRKRLSGS